MATTALRKDERLGLAVAIALHAALLAVLVLRPTRNETIPPPQRIEVTISDEVGLKSTAPNPSAQAAPDVAPELGEAAPDAALAPPEPEAQPSPLPPAPVAPPVTRPAPPAKPKPVPAPAPKPKPEPQPKPQPQPRPAPQPPKKAVNPIDRIVSSPAKPAAKPATKPAAAPAGKAANTAAKPPQKSGGSRIGSDFLSGMSGAKADQGKGTPASEIGPAVKSALGAAIRRQLKPHWQVPQGVDTELLVTRIRFRLNPDGSLAGDPEVVSTSGQTEGNAAQVKRHQEQAIRAVRLAAPFDLPQEYYQGWKMITTNFDRNLAQ
ncbi:TonB C-terminal domain-containing protein [Novosphingobium colocasiae]|uniref:Cell envelope biogenesis protein TolA n=1 Tax=Novosphingobium colocasiae TaxID=1256513 RepID=A0A918PHY7_9SPHN|nr:TonB C-terminal domain-containing protein [Novosphingobium colocasiae]GGZ07464.1 hypothetical protein GCM10011614_23010 [Novosphingobium colocasiae]